eukprot:SAG31_NODE_452_length_15484_cov_20.883198_8_plen_77_part_00
MEKNFGPRAPPTAVLTWRAALAGQGSRFTSARQAIADVGAIDDVKRACRRRRRDRHNMHDTAAAVSQVEYAHDRPD